MPGGSQTKAEGRVNQNRYGEEWLVESPLARKVSLMNDRMDYNDAVVQFVAFLVKSWNFESCDTIRPLFCGWRGRCFGETLGECMFCPDRLPTAGFCTRYFAGSSLHVQRKRKCAR